MTTVAGAWSPGFADGYGSGARFNYPEGVAMDAAGSFAILVRDDVRQKRMGFEH